MHRHNRRAQLRAGSLRLSRPRDLLQVRHIRQFSEMFAGDHVPRRRAGRAFQKSLPSADLRAAQVGL